MWESGFTEFKLDFTGTKNLAIGDFVPSDYFSAGGHVWRVRCYPRGDNADSHGFYLSLYLQLVSNSKNVKAIFECLVIGRDGEPSTTDSKRTSFRAYPPDGNSASHGCGFQEFIPRYELERYYLMADGSVTFMLGVIVQQWDNPTIPVPTSDIAGHIGRLLDCADGSHDVTFSVGGETFHAHRAVLAARPPVFKAQLFGSMADARMRCITLHDIKPETFQMLLQFMYTDELPRDEEIQSSSNSSIDIFCLMKNALRRDRKKNSSIDMYLDLLAVADMYQLDRLKLMCARRLWDCVSGETVAKILNCAEMYNCSELKSTCLDSFVLEKNFKIAVLTDGYFQLMQNFPSVIDEIRARRGFVRPKTSRSLFRRLAAALR